MRRRKFVTLLVGAAAWPLGAQAQQPAMPVVGLLGSGSAEAYAQLVGSFRRGLNEAGYVEGQNVLIEYRWAEDQYDRLPALAAELVSRQVAVLFALNDPSARVAKAATATVPILFISSDPVKLGLVASLNRPGGNVTGVSILSATLEAKRLEFLLELVPKAQAVAVLINPNNPPAEGQLADAQGAARTLGRHIQVLRASSEREIDMAFAALVEQRAGALLVGSDPFFNQRYEKLVLLAARNAVPAAYAWREFPASGGLMSYGTSRSDAYRLVGIYAGRVLKGEKPADLPVQQSVKVELVINLKTAKALGLAVPITLLGRADEVIE
jgi:putative tryptophan/tyrosine transport system substrate-binding protein